MEAIVNGAKIRYEVAGAGPAVVMLHAFPLCRKMWTPQVGALGAARFRTIAPDFRGYGESVGPEAKGLDVFARDIIGLLNYLGIGRAAFVGHGFGGQVLLEILERYPQRVAASCFVATAPRLDSPSQRAALTVLAGRVHEHGSPILLESLAPGFLTDDLLARQPLYRPEIRRWIAAASPSAAIATLLALRDRPELDTRHLPSGIPALVMGGEADATVPASAGKLLAGALPYATCRLIPQAGHLVNLERSAEFNETLLSFLRSISWGRPFQSLRRVA